MLARLGFSPVINPFNLHDVCAFVCVCVCVWGQVVVCGGVYSGCVGRGVFVNVKLIYYES